MKVTCSSLPMKSLITVKMFNLSCPEPLSSFSNVAMSDINMFETFCFRAFTDVTVKVLAITF